MEALALRMTTWFGSSTCGPGWDGLTLLIWSLKLGALSIFILVALAMIRLRRTVQSENQLTDVGTLTLIAAGSLATGLLAAFLEMALCS